MTNYKLTSSKSILFFFAESPLGQKLSSQHSPQQIQQQQPSQSQLQSQPVQQQQQLSRSAAIRSAKMKANLQRTRNQTPSTPGAPGAALVAMPPRKPGAALCVMPPKKRSKLEANLLEETASHSKDFNEQVAKRSYVAND